MRKSTISCPRQLLLIACGLMASECTKKTQSAYQMFGHRQAWQQTIDAWKRQDKIQCLNNLRYHPQQQSLTQLFQEIRKSGSRLVYHMNSAHIDARTQSWATGQTPLHIAVRYNNPAAIKLLLKDLAEKADQLARYSTRPQRPQHIKKAIFTHWINIEDDQGQTALDLAQDQSSYNILAKKGAQRGSQLGYREKLSADATFFQDLNNELRWCLYNENNHKAQQIAHYFNQVANQQLLTATGWIRERRELQNMDIPIDIAGKIGHYTGAWFNLPNQQGIMLLDEMALAQQGNSLLYKQLEEAGARYSDFYIEEKLQDPAYMEFYQAYLPDLQYFFKYATGKVWKNDRVGPLWAFLKKAMDKGRLQKRLAAAVALQNQNRQPSRRGSAALCHQRCRKQVHRQAVGASWRLLQGHARRAATVSLQYLCAKQSDQENEP